MAMSQALATVSSSSLVRSFPWVVLAVTETTITVALYVVQLAQKIVKEYTRYLGEVLEQVFIVFHIFKLIPQFLGCVQIFQGLNQDMLSLNS